MNPEKQRIKIAEVRGFYEEEPWLDGRPCWGHKDHPKYIGFEEIPDYLYDLNAMHEAENHFVGDASKAMTYAMHLLRACGLFITSEYDELNVDYCWHACHATAAQRAEAFLKTLNLWTEE